MITFQNANHWVLAKKIKITDGNISASVYTWGRQFRPREVPAAVFLNGYSGFVAALG
jgi:hypothetical protein